MKALSDGLRSLFAVAAASCVVGCAVNPHAPSPAAPAAPVWIGCPLGPCESVSATPDGPRVTVSLDGLSPAALAAYQTRHVSVRVIGADRQSVVLLRGDQNAISEREFGESYRAVTRSSDLDVDAHRRAVRKNPTVIGMGIGATVVGVGGLTAVALLEPNICHDAQGKELPGCGKAVLGLGVLAVIGAVGVYVLGCEAIKGADCIADGNIGAGGAALSPDAAAYYVDRYNAALAAALRDGAVPSVPVGRSVEEKKPTARMRITPFGVAGAF